MPRPIEPHLGDVVGEEPIRLRPQYRRRFDQPRWIENGVRWVVDTVATVVLVVLVIAAVLMFFWASLGVYK